MRRSACSRCVHIPLRPLPHVHLLRSLTLQVLLRFVLPACDDPLVLSGAQSDVQSLPASVPTPRGLALTSFVRPPYGEERPGRSMAFASHEEDRRARTKAAASHGFPVLGEASAPPHPLPARRKGCLQPLCLCGVALASASLGN